MQVVIRVTKRIVRLGRAVLFPSSTHSYHIVVDIVGHDIILQKSRKTRKKVNLPLHGATCKLYLQPKCRAILITFFAFESLEVHGYNTTPQGSTPTKFSVRRSALFRHTTPFRHVPMACGQTAAEPWFQQATWPEFYTVRWP